MHETMWADITAQENSVIVVQSMLPPSLLVDQLVLNFVQRQKLISQLEMKFWH